MKRLYLLLLIVFPVYLVASIYFLDKDYFLCPIGYRGNILVRYDSRGSGFFASRRNGHRMHEGIDLFAEIGTPVLAARSGRVVAAQRSRGMGNYIVIRHAGGILTIYGHLSQIFVPAGAIVRQGQVIASVGKTGNANYSAIQPHLHFEVRRAGMPQDPLEYLE